METPQTDLLDSFTQVSRTFEQLSQRLAEVARQARSSGRLPAQSLIEEITSSRGNFTELRDQALELIALLAKSSPQSPDASESLKGLATLLQSLTDTRRKDGQEDQTRIRALTVLDRILSLTHRDHPEFPPLEAVQGTASVLRDTLRNHTGTEAHPDMVSLAQGRHPLAELLTLVEGYDHLEDDLWLLLKHAVAEHFGKSIALSAARGRLRPSPARLGRRPLSEDARNGRLPSAFPS